MLALDVLDDVEEGGLIDGPRQPEPPEAGRSRPVGRRSHPCSHRGVDSGDDSQPLTARIPGERDGLGRLRVDEYVRVVGVPDVCTAGDTAAVLANRAINAQWIYPPVDSPEAFITKAGRF